MKTYVALGTNLGDRLLNLGEARRQLARLGEHRAGPIVETEALLPPGDRSPQPKYLNSVDELEVQFTAIELFRELKRIERRMGRVVTKRWAPRIIDLDLVLFGEEILQTPELTVPHASMHERLFVLEPLAQLAPEARHPVLQKTVRELLHQLQGR